jgi:hypothetical protein
MHAQKPHGGFADWVARIDFVPRLRELAQSVECLRRRRIVKSIVAFEARKRWRAFDLRRSPQAHWCERRNFAEARRDRRTPRSRSAADTGSRDVASTPRVDVPAVLVGLIGYRS